MEGPLLRTTAPLASHLPHLLSGVQQACALWRGVPCQCTSSATLLCQQTSEKKPSTAAYSAAQALRTVGPGSHTARCTLRLCQALHMAAPSAWGQTLRKSSGMSHPWALNHARRSISHSYSHQASVVAFPLAQTGEGISECELIQWFVKEGDAVKEFDKLCEVQSDKASVEISSRFDGVVRKLVHQKGDVVKVGATLVELEVPAGTPIPPDLAQHVKDETVPSTDPAAVAAAPQQAHSHQMPSTATQEAASHRDASHARHGTHLEHPAAAGAGSQGSDDKEVLASPSVRRMARDMGVVLAALAPGTGPGGRITKDDLLKYASTHASSPATAAAAPNATAHMPPTPAPAIPRPPPQGSSVLPLRGYRKAMVKSMTAVASVPHFHLHDEACVDVLGDIRKALAKDTALHGAKLTMLPFIIKAMSLVLLEHPLLNASLAPEQTSITLHGSHNIGVAMATPHGLAVPNIKQVESLSVAQIAREIARLQAAAASNKLTTEDITGGTITVSNIGSIGGLLANPLVNPPEVVILAVGRVRQVAAAGARVPSGLSHRHTLADAPGAAGPVQHCVGLSWGADHRVVDGAALAVASNLLKSYLESPERMLMKLA